MFQVTAALLVRFAWNLPSAPVTNEHMLPGPTTTHTSENGTPASVVTMPLTHVKPSCGHPTVAEGVAVAESGVEDGCDPTGAQPTSSSNTLASALRMHPSYRNRCMRALGCSSSAAPPKSHAPSRSTTMPANAIGSSSVGPGTQVFATRS